MRFHRLFCQTSTSRTHLSLSTNENARLLNLNVSPRAVAKQVVDMSEDMLICTPPELQEMASSAIANLLSNKSSVIYEKAYQKFCNGHKNIMSKTTVKMYSLYTFQKSQRYANHQRCGLITQC